MTRSTATFLWLVVGVVGGCVASPDIVARTRETAGHAGATEPQGGAASTSTGGTASTKGGTGSDGPAGAWGGTGPEGTPGGAAPAGRALELTGALETHDSSVIEVDGRYTLFHTGPGISVKTSNDLRNWEAAPQVFAENPAWVGERVPEATVLWAPDITYFGNTYHLYYAASSFGSGRSCIGHATKTALDSSDDWADRGPVICSNVGTTGDDWDAIDPSTFADVDGTWWLTFGSFGSGIKLIRLDETGARVGDEFYPLAARPVEKAIQAPFLTYRSPYYFLFVSFDRCCQGITSTSNIRVGRSSNLSGPYTDRDGTPLLEGGGTLLLAGNDRWAGVGANTLLTTQGRDYNVYHSYDANAAGRATLRISEIAWDAKGWPLSGGP